jgi:hypothetical protein
MCILNEKLWLRVQKLPENRKRLFSGILTKNLDAMKGWPKAVAGNAFFSAVFWAINGEMQTSAALSPS